MIVIVTTGASCVGELLKVNNSLQELEMGYNPTISDDGMSSVADGLQCNNTLTKLQVQQWGLSVKGTTMIIARCFHIFALVVVEIDSYHKIIRENFQIYYNGFVVYYKMHKM